MSVYFIGTVNIHDHDEYKKYVKGFIAMFGRYKGEVLVADQNPQLLEGEWPFFRTVIIRFDNRDDALAWYNSPDYQEVAKFRFTSATTNLVLASGLG